MDDTQKNILVYDKLRESLETEHMSKWVIIYNEKLISVHDTFESAANEAIKKFGSSSFLIRQVGAPPVILPASVMYSPNYGAN